MKIALIGNMNNNNFSILRYFRDLGEDAHLFLWANDGVGTLSHFRPELDSPDINKWINYIHKTDLVNGYSSLFFDPRRLKLPPSTKYIVNLFKDFDCLIGSGLSPAILHRAGLKLDIFYPYGSGVEFVGLGIDRSLLASRKYIKKFIFKLARKKQIRGIKEARYRFISELGLTLDTLNEISCEHLVVPIPMVYNEECIEHHHIRDDLKKALVEVNNKGLTIFSHASHMWVKKSSYSENEWPKATKNNHWLIAGFADFLKLNKDTKALLLLVEYGRDVQASKDLCQQLGITNNVLWLPKMSRVEIMYFLSHCDIGVGEFTISPGCLWGGTGWEVLASGKPLLQTFNFSNEEYVGSFNNEPPPILDVKSKEDITRYLLDYCLDKEKYLQIGVNGKKWFDKCSGIGLAKKWLDLLEK